MRKTELLIWMVYAIMVITMVFVVGEVEIVMAAAPDTPVLEYPANASTLQDTSVSLIVSVNDADVGMLNVTFYNSSSGALIGYNDVVNTSGKAACVWSGLKHGNSYWWYANVSDDSDTTQSANFTFTLATATKSSSQDDTYLDPSGDNLGWMDITNTTQIMLVTVRPFTDVMGSWFYAIMIYSFVGLIYVKTQRAFLPSAVLMLCGITMASVLPGEVTFITLSMIGFGFVGIVYHIAKRRL